MLHRAIDVPAQSWSSGHVTSSEKPFRISAWGLCAPSSIPAGAAIFLVYVLGFAAHIWSLFHILLCFIGSFVCLVFFYNPLKMYKPFLAS